MTSDEISTIMASGGFGKFYTEFDCHQSPPRFHVLSSRNSHFRDSVDNFHLFGILWKQLPFDLQFNY